jgi:hypothetical protein
MSEFHTSFRVKGVTYLLKPRGDAGRKNLVAASWLRHAASVKSERYPESMASFSMEDVEFLDFRTVLYK